MAAIAQAVSGGQLTPEMRRSPLLLFRNVYHYHWSKCSHCDHRKELGRSPSVMDA